MNYTKTLSEMGLRELPKSPESNGFTHPLVFVLPARAQTLMEMKYNLFELPHAIITKGGLVTDNGQSLSRAEYFTPIRYKLITIDVKGKCFKALSSGDGTPIEMIDGNGDLYDISTGPVYIAEKYFRKQFSEISSS